MNFYYDPILGLQYNNLGDYILLDLKVIPEDITVEKFLEECKFMHSQIEIQFYSCVEPILKITNYKL